MSKPLPKKRIELARALKCLIILVLLSFGGNYADARLFIDADEGDGHPGADAAEEIETAGICGSALASMIYENLRKYCDDIFINLMLGRRERAGMGGINSNNPIIQTLGLAIMRLIVPLFMLIITLTGGYYVWGAVSPSIRAQVKGQLLKLLVGLVAAGFSFSIFDMLIELNNWMVLEILNTPIGTGGDIVGENWDPMCNGLIENAGPGMTYAAGIIGVIAWLTIGIGLSLIIPIICGIIAMVLLPYLVLSIRWVACLIFGAILPFTIFLQAFEVTKGLGTKLMKQTLTWIFLPLPMAVMILISNALAQGASAWTPHHAFGSLAAFVLIGIVPMMAAGMMGAAGGLGIWVGQTSGRSDMVFMGYVMQGHSAQAFTQAAFHAQRMDNRGQSHRDTAAGYKTGGGVPVSADTGQPALKTGSAYYEALKEANQGQGSASPPPRVYGNRQYGDGGGGMSGIDEQGIGISEMIKRAFFGRPVEAGKSVSEMSSQQYRGLMAAASWKKGGIGGALGAGWHTGMAVASNWKKLMIPAGFMLRGIIRHSIDGTGIGKSLTNVSNKMTGYWDTDHATGKQIFNYGWQSSRGIMAGLSEASGNLYRSHDGKGVPPMMKAALIGASIPLAMYALPIGAGVGLSVVGIAAVGGAVGARLFRPRGEANQANQNLRKMAHEKMKANKKIGKDDVWSNMSDGQRAAYGYKPGMTGEELDNAKTRAHQDFMWSQLSDEQKKAYKEKTYTRDDVWDDMSDAQRHNYNPSGNPDDPGIGEAKKKAREDFLKGELIPEKLPGYMRGSESKSQYEDERYQTARKYAAADINSGVIKPEGLAESAGVKSNFDGLDKKTRDIYKNPMEEKLSEDVGKSKKALDKANKEKSENEKESREKYEESTDKIKDADGRDKGWDMLTSDEKKTRGYDEKSHNTEIDKARKGYENAKYVRDLTRNSQTENWLAAEQYFSGLSVNERDEAIKKAREELGAERPSGIISDKDAFDRAVANKYKEKMESVNLIFDPEKERRHNQAVVDLTDRDTWIEEMKFTATINRENLGLTGYQKTLLDQSNDSGKTEAQKDQAFSRFTESLSKEQRNRLFDETAKNLKQDVKDSIGDENKQNKWKAAIAMAATDYTNNVIMRQMKREKQEPGASGLTRQQEYRKDVIMSNIKDAETKYTPEQRQRMAYAISGGRTGLFEHLSDKERQKLAIALETGKISRKTGEARGKIVHDDVESFVKNEKSIRENEGTGLTWTGAILGMGDKKGDVEGGYSYVYGAKNVENDLNRANDWKIDGNRIEGADNSAYFFERDGVYKADDSWGKNMRRLSEGEASAARKWAGQNHDKTVDGVAIRPHPDTNPDVSDRSMENVMTGDSGSELRKLSIWDERRDDYSLEKIESQREKVGEIIWSNMSEKDRNQFGGGANMSESENRRAMHRATDYFMDEDRRMRAVRDDLDSDKGWSVKRGPISTSTGRLPQIVGNDGSSYTQRDSSGPDRYTHEKDGESRKLTWGEARVVDEYLKNRKVDE